MGSIMTTVYSMPPGTGNRICCFVRQSISVWTTENPHTHAFIKVMRITGGRAEWVVNNVCHILEPGMFVILNDTELRHIREIYSEEPLTLDWFQFQPLTIFSQMPVDACTRLCSIFYLRPAGFSNVIPAGSPRSAEIMQIYESLVQNAEQSDMIQDEAVIGCLYMLLVEITRHYTAVLGSDFLKNKMASAGNFQKLTEAIMYVHEHFQEDITEDQVAGAVLLSPSYFARLFQNCYGIRFRSYLRQFRLEKTLELLRSSAGSELTVLDAAMTCGFNSASGFYKCLHDIYNTGNCKEVIRNMGF